MGIRKKFSERWAVSKHDLEDIELSHSLSVHWSWLKVQLNPGLYVYLAQISVQSFSDKLYRFGQRRVWFNDTEKLKLTHMFPGCFCFVLRYRGQFASFFFRSHCEAFITILGGYFLIIFLDTTARTKALGLGWKTFSPLWLQLTGYGLGFLQMHSRFVFGKERQTELRASKWRIVKNKMQVATYNMHLCNFVFITMALTMKCFLRDHHASSHVSINPEVNKMNRIWKRVH